VNPPRFSVGDRVRVADRAPQGHTRTPAYARGHVGAIERCCGAYPDPEHVAYRSQGAARRDLYRVRFELWRLFSGYAGPRADTLDIEIYDHWLDPATTETPDETPDAP
jgi:nitrile hydratase